MSTPELAERLENEQANLNRLKMGHVISPLDNPMQIRVLRKDIARMNTELVKRNHEEKGTTE